MIRRYWSTTEEAVFLALVLLDHATKVAAFVFLEDRPEIPLPLDFELSYVVNRYAIPVVLPPGWTARHVVIASFVLLLMGLVLWALAGRRIGRGWKLLLVLAVGAAGIRAVPSLAPLLPIDARAAPWPAVQLGCRVFPWVVLLGVSRGTVFRWPLLVFLAGGFANFLSLCYPPFGAVDFLSYPPLLGIYVINLADVINVTGAVGLLLASGVASIQGLARIWSAPERDLAR